ncbi:ankyrin repeat-containing domain protein [Mycena sanguinolenta]|nr:ankyrin repeat-containing domain protein [Mycena sanguinolenta]
MPSPDVCNILPSWVSVLIETREEYLGRALLQSTSAGNLEISEYLLQEGADVNFCQGSYTPLVYAVFSKKLGLVKFLLASGADPNLTGSGEIVPLFGAAMGRSMELVEALLTGGADIHAEDFSGSNVLPFAQDILTLRFFLERGVDPNHRDASGRTPLHYACYIADLEISQYLLSQGADINFLHRLGTPLYWAVSSKNLQVVQFLLASGAEPNRSGYGGAVPLFTAAALGSMELVKALLAGGANIHAEDFSGSNVLPFAQDTPMLRFLLEQGVDPNHRNQVGATPLHYACRRPDTAHARIELLLQFGAVTAGDADNYGHTPEMAARVHARDSEDNGFTALDYAARAKHLDIVHLLAPIALPAPHVSAIPSPFYETQEKYLSIALVEASQAGSVEIAEHLLTQGANVNFLDEHVYPGTALFFAARTSLALVQLLLASGADPNLSTSHTSPPLFRAANVEISKALVSAGANIHAKNSDSRNLLASRFGDVEMLRFALERGVDPNNKDNFGWTPLHHVCNMMPMFAIPLVKELLQFGAARVEEVGGREGLTPVELAMRYASPELVRMLEPLVQDHNFKLKIATWLKEREGRS